MTKNPSVIHIIPLALSLIHLNINFSDQMPVNYGMSTVEYWWITVDINTEFGTFVI